MSKLRSLSSPALCAGALRLVAEERRITLELIDHLREIERRMLFAEMGYGSLFEFCTRRLGLSEGSAQRRISAMRLARDVPEARAALTEGKLSLSNASKLQSAFRAQKSAAAALAPAEKAAVVAQVAGLSQRECENKLFEVLPLAMAEQNRERERLVGVDTTEVRLVIGPELGAKLARLKDLHSHSVPDGSLLGLLDLMADRELARLEKKHGISEAGTSATAAAVRTEKFLSDNRRVAIPAAVRRAVWRKARGACEHPGCRSRYQLQIDHRVPVTLGGANEAGNLRLLCREHNLQQAKAKLGARKMARFLPSLR